MEIQRILDEGFREIIRGLYEVEQQAREIRDELEAGGQNTLATHAIGEKIVDLETTAGGVRDNGMIWATVAMLDEKRNPFT